jgi:hypothetical protein
LTSRRILVLLLLGSLIFRIALIANGVQDTPDDLRYNRALDLIHTQAYESLLTTYDHMGFTVVSLLPAAVQLITSVLSHQGFDHLYAIPALFFCWASVGCIALIYGIALRAGASRREALIAALLLALSNCMFYWVPYVMPYDLSLFLMLLALYVGLGQGKPRQRWFAVGLFVWCGFLIYNAHWLIGAVVLALCVFQDRRIAARALYCGLGFILLPLLLTGVTGGAYLVGLLRFGDTVTQGLFSEGWSLPFETFWYAERLMLVVWLVGMIAALAAYRRRQRRWADGRVIVWLLALLAVYAVLVLGSVVLNKFVVYGRNARQMIPFVVLLAAYGMAHLPPSALRALGVAAALVAIPNLVLPFTIAVPRDTEFRAQAEVGTYRRDFTVTGSLWKPDGSGRYVLLNTQTIYPVVGVQPAPAGRVLFSVPHPYRFEALLYEGYTPQERALVRSARLEMTLIDTGG